MQYTFISKLYRYGIHLQTNCTGTVYIYKQIVHERYTFINELAEGPGIDRGKKNWKNVEKMSVPKKISPIGPAVWPAIRNIYTNVLFHYIRIINSIICKFVSRDQNSNQLQCRYWSRDYEILRFHPFIFLLHSL